MAPRSPRLAGGARRRGTAGADECAGGAGLSTRSPEPRPCGTLPSWSTRPISPSIRTGRPDGTFAPPRCPCLAAPRPGPPMTETRSVPPVPDALLLGAAVPSDRFLAAIVESSDDAIITKTLDGTITSWNRGAELLYGHTAAEAIGRPISLIIPPERPDELPSIMARLRRGERVDHYETVRLRKDGARLDVSVSISPIRNDAGTIVGAASIGRDISERTRAERERRALEQQAQQELAARRESEERFRAVWEATSEALALSDPDGIVLAVNPAYCALYGRPAEAVRRSQLRPHLPGGGTGRGGGAVPRRLRRPRPAAELRGPRAATGWQRARRRGAGRLPGPRRGAGGDGLGHPRRHRAQASRPGPAGFRGHGQPRPGLAADRPARPGAAAAAAPGATTRRASPPSWSRRAGWIG